MNSVLSKTLFFYPITLMKGEPIAFLIGSYRQNQWISKREIEELQLNAFKEAMQHAINHSDFYRELYKSHDISVKDIITLSDIKTVPTVSKDNLIQSLKFMSTNSSNGIFSSVKTTGGSTGQPVKLYKNSLALARERCATARAYEWAGVGIGDSQLRFWGIPHSKKSQKISQLTDLVANRKRVSAFDLTEESLSRYYEQCKTFKPKYIYGYVSVIEQFAKFIIDNDMNPIPSIKSVITTAEILNSNARATIESAFDTKVFNEYGCGEVGSIAHECEAGNMHIMADNLYLEVDGTKENSGEIIVTDFFNKATPLIRYRLGDFATLSDTQCSCGRSLPIIKSIHGRAYDILEMPSGKKMHPESVIYVFEQIQKDTNAFKQFQVIQHSPYDVEAKIITNNNWSETISKRLIEELRLYIDQSAQFRITLVDNLPREKSGKMRLVKRNF
jgi:phenylacetate-CoA ligase